MLSFLTQRTRLADSGPPLRLFSFPPEKIAILCLERNGSVSNKKIEELPVDFYTIPVDYLTFERLSIKKYTLGITFAGISSYLCNRWVGRIPTHRDARCDLAISRYHHCLAPGKSVRPRGSAALRSARGGDSNRQPARITPGERRRHARSRQRTRRLPPRLRRTRAAHRTRTPAHPAGPKADLRLARRSLGEGRSIHSIGHDGIAASISPISRIVSPNAVTTLR